ncbi:MAG: FAD-binding protein [Gemmatimonadetes bacterium]|nr:FAD-binding protein [Gemmatimonadota bacterium]MDA1102722.1 FAD-binding protein [Gemmatimonadota bacterium]
MAETSIKPGDPALAAELRRAIQGEVHFDAFTRGLYSTDASHYQVEPLGVVFPRSTQDVEAVFDVARTWGVPVLPRGGGTSQCGQTVGRAVVLDTNRHLTGIGDLTGREIEVQPGVVLDHLNAGLKSSGLWFPVDPSTGSRATLGGMAGNNSAGARSIEYGMMADNVPALEVVLPDGRRFWVGEDGVEAEAMPDELAALRAIFAREADEIGRRTPRTSRNVAGYNLDRLRPDRENLAQLLVGSEGTLAFFSRLRLKLSPLPRRRVLGVCHFSGLLEALDTVQHLVSLGPSAVELVDRNVLALAAERPDFRAAMSSFVRGAPGALLLVEFASPDAGADLRPRLEALAALLGDLGHPGCVVFSESAASQADVWSIRKAGLNIVMSMAGPRKPVSFIEDCAVPLEHLAEYARRVDEIFARHDTAGTWYAHASVGCLHVRPALNLKDPHDVGLIRRIAEETHEVVREFGGTHSGEHGDGILRSEFLRSMVGERLTSAYGEVKRTFDPSGMMNPGKIVDPPRMDDRTLFRYPPSYRARDLPVVLDWGADGGFLGAIERCNNNGACRKSDPGVMCPSFRVTQDERHSTRGRANALRLALTDQLGDDGLDSPEMADAMSLCISCKGCRRECPTGVDMARMKLEWQHRRNQRSGVPTRERLFAALPRIAPRVHRFGPLLNAAARTPATRLLGIAPERVLPRWHGHPWRDEEIPNQQRPEVALFVDTFARWFEPETARAARTLLTYGGRPATSLSPPPGERPLCCGRTYLSAGMLDEAKMEAGRLLAAALPLARAGLPIVGLEPSCLYTLRDEIPGLFPGPDARLVAEQAQSLEEYLEAEWGRDRTLPFAEPSDSERNEPSRVLVHGHCHQKAFGGVDATLSMLRRIPGVNVEPVASGCCGMAGAFGYHAEHYSTSIAMGELELLPKVRAEDARTCIVANGTSCRAQIADGTGRRAVHAAIVLRDALADGLA